MDYNVSKKMNGWSITSTGYEVVVFEGNGMGKCIVIDGMKVAAKVIFIDDMMRVNTIEGYAVQINCNEKTMSIIKEIKP